MAAPIGYRLPKVPLDKWSTVERLALASSVRISGNQNWVSVSRAIKPFGERGRPPNWFSQKNCALQYADLLEKAETPKRKRGEKGEREVIETPAIQIVQKLTVERIEELKQLFRDEQQQYKQLKKEYEALKAGKYDDQLDEMLEKMQTEKKAAEELKQEEIRKQEEEAAQRAKLIAMRKAAGGLQRTSSTVSSVSEVDESTQDSIPEHLNVETTDDECPATPTVSIQPLSIEIPVSVGGESTRPVPPTSPLLSSLLQSKQFTVDSLEQIKAEAEAEHAQKQTKPTNEMDIQLQLANQQPEQIVTTTIETTEVYVEPQIHVDVSKVKVETDHVPLPEVKTEMDIITTEPDVHQTMCKEEIVEYDGMVVEETIEVSTHESPVKTQPPKPVMDEIVVTNVVPPASSYVNVEEDVSVTEDPVSPASSISSRVSESGSKSSLHKAKFSRQPGGVRRSSVRSMRRSTTIDDQSSRHSDAETTDDDGDSSLLNLQSSGTLALSESIPNSPHSSHCSDTEDDKAYKAWKKSIMLVWRNAANHKYANVFLHQVTDDIAPGYSTVVRRPKDLTIIKRHIENGTIRTTAEFQRDMMLMFTNAIMYNSVDHDVYRIAIEMYNDVLEHIEQYVSTQIMVQNTEAKLLRPTRRNDNSDKEEESRRRRTSSEAEGGKAKKRRSRADET